MRFPPFITWPNVFLLNRPAIFPTSPNGNNPLIFICDHRYASEVDVNLVRKAVRSISRLAIKIPFASDHCISVLLDLVATKINYVLQEAIIVIKDISRKYPNQYEGIIGSLCQNLDALNSPKAKALMIWIISQYADRIKNSDELPEDFVFTFLEEPVERLLLTNPAASRYIVMVGKPSISTESESLDPAVLDRLLLQTGTLSPVYHRSPGIFIWHTKPKYLRDSPALNPAAKKLYQESLEIAVRRPPPVPETITVPKARAPAAVTKEDVSTEDMYDQDDLYAVLSSLDPSGVYVHSPGNYQADEPQPLSGMIHHPVGLAFLFSYSHSRLRSRLQAALDAKKGSKFDYTRSNPKEENPTEIADDLLKPIEGDLARLSAKTIVDPTKTKRLIWHGVYLCRFDIALRRDPNVNIFCHLVGLRQTDKPLLAL
ncbi:hypothetical protein MJO29_015687 [Puccinia striiformis f. sp. tritici]|nr:hypothetical protein MJO29_015687 [Puccinia striiformis f. sp. tritici]